MTGERTEPTSDRSIECATYLRQLNHMRESLIRQHSRESATDDKLGQAIDEIANVIVLLGGSVREVPGWDCAEVTR